MNDFVKIMTLNVNGFRGIKGDINERVPYNICLQYMMQIKQRIDKVMIKKNDIIILQEIPHKIMKRGNWFDDPLYNKFEDIFQEYKILKPKHLINSKQCTVAICKKDSSWEQLTKDILQYDTMNSYGNKFVELQCDDITLLGVHMPTDNMMWDLLIHALNGSPYTCIIGDFNANEKRGEMNNKPEDIRKCGYNSLITNDTITCYSCQTSIDNIYIKSDFTMHKNTEVEIVNTKLTDHALCILKYHC